MAPRRRSVKQSRKTLTKCTPSLSGEPVCAMNSRFWVLTLWWMHLLWRHSNGHEHFELGYIWFSAKNPPRLVQGCIILYTYLRPESSFCCYCTTCCTPRNPQEETCEVIHKNQTFSGVYHLPSALFRFRSPTEACTVHISYHFVEESENLDQERSTYGTDSWVPDTKIVYCYNKWLDSVTRSFVGSTSAELASYLWRQAHNLEYRREASVELTPLTMKFNSALHWAHTL